ncbi:MAG TPA: YwiC-like family protein [Vicinamibacterales bacterium]|nr:YwiC-like family protein [Vicinamibacterales bacterium]
MLPREHGAYGQLAFPLITSFAVAGFSTAATLIGLSAVAAFLVHEPLLVLLGRRGVRAGRDHRRAAIGALGGAGIFAIGAGLIAGVVMPPPMRWSLVLPLIPAACFTIAIALGREKRALGEVAAALTFSFVSVPICLASGAPMRTALSVAGTFASIFVTATLAVRVVILRVRGGGDPRRERATRAAVLMLALVIGVALLAALARHATSWPTLAAVAPGLVGAAWLSLLPPPPTRLRTVGWTLVTTSATAAAILIAGL